VITDEGEDVTDAFQDGANKVLDICSEVGATRAILKSKSPSCGTKEVYDGNFNGTLIKGHGVTAKMLIENGIEVISSDDYK
jgi:uncharacterized protein YbbK (DUF523 family)